MTTATDPKAIRMRTAAVTILVVVFAAGCGGGSDSTAQTSSTPSASPLTAVGSMSVRGGGVPAFGSEGEPCVALGGYTDIAEGTQVVISGEDGTTLAVGRLQSGEITVGGGFRSCRFYFTVPDIPPGHRFYELEVGRRGSLQYTAQDLKGHIALTLG
jgi:hypothetical protein